MLLLLRGSEVTVSDEMDILRTTDQASTDVRLSATRDDDDNDEWILCHEKEGEREKERNFCLQSLS